MDQFVFEKERIIHLDLKSCPLKVDYLKEVFSFVKNKGASGLLIEWEDTFPYTNELVDIGSSRNGSAYTASEVAEILNSAKLRNLMVIPLIQTFGHLEFVLKTERWCELREVTQYASSLCPSHPESFPLVTSMIEQVMDQHPDSLFLHVGGDEVWHLGMCENCCHHDKHTLFLTHMLKVLQFIRETYPQITPIMWDDMLRNIDLETLRNSNIGKFVEPMIWEYRQLESFSLPLELFEKYSQIFPNIWIASAFKGAVGSCKIYPIFGHYISNHEKWLLVVEEIRNKFKSIRGIVMTGWSRYDHYAALCELLPSGLISLTLCLRTWLLGKYNEDMFLQTSKILGFDEANPISLYPINRPVVSPQKLNFPGYLVHVNIEWFESVRAKFNFVANSDQAVTWLNKWQVKRNHTSKMQVEHIFINFKNLLNELTAVEQQLHMSMKEVYYDETIEEWFGCYLYPLKEKLMELIADAESQLKI